MKAWSTNYITMDSTGEKAFEITDTKLYIPVVILLTKTSSKLLVQLKSRFKRIINWNTYQWKVSTQTQNQYLDCLINSGFQGANRLFVLYFEGNTVRTGHTVSVLPSIEIKDCNGMTDGQKFFEMPVKNKILTYASIQKIATGQGDNYATGCQMEHPYIKKNCELNVVDLSKQQTLNADQNAIQ